MKCKFHKKLEIKTNAIGKITMSRQELQTEAQRIYEDNSAIVISEMMNGLMRRHSTIWEVIKDRYLELKLEKPTSQDELVYWFIIAMQCENSTDCSRLLTYCYRRDYEHVQNCWTKALSLAKVGNFKLFY